MRFTGINQGELSAILHGKKPFGEKKARRIEEDAGLPKYWLDTTDDEAVEKKPILLEKPVKTAAFDVLDVKASCGPGYLNRTEQKDIPPPMPPQNRGRGFAQDEAPKKNAK